MEKITGNAITNLLKELIHDKTPLKLTLIDSDVEHRIRITGLANRKKTPHLVIDLPEGFEHAAADIADGQMNFEFTGKDQIKYVFTTHGAEIAAGQIYLKVPQVLERKQRRAQFRLNAPAGTRLRFFQDAELRSLDVLNISIGGSLAATVRTQADIPENAPFTIAQKLQDVHLAFAPEILQQPIQVEAVRIKRIRKNPQSMRYEVGLEFCEISKGEQKRLTDLIYRLQRRYLRNRLPMEF